MGLDEFVANTNLESIEDLVSDLSSHRDAVVKLDASTFRQLNSYAHAIGAAHVICNAIKKNILLTK